MTLISQSIKSFIGGVSQQPDVIRFPDQVTELINGFPNEVEGLQKRPPTLHVKRLTSHIDGKASKFHVIDRDGDERYFLRLYSGGFEVYDFKGVKKDCSAENSWVMDYLKTSNPATKLKAVTVADYTFILNTEKVVGDVFGSSPDGYSKTSLIYIRNVQYGKATKIYVDGKPLAGIRTPTGRAEGDAKLTSTDVVASHFYEALANGRIKNAEGFVKADSIDAVENVANNKGGIWWDDTLRQDFTIKVCGDSVLAITPRSGLRADFTVKDGLGNQYARECSGAVSTVTKLPPAAPHGYVVRITGEKKSEDDDFYVKWDDKSKVWKETIAPNIPYKISPSTMPHAIVREEDGRFVLKELEWIDRETGDENTNPDPSFIGQPINDIFFYRNRLGMVSDESIILSAVNDFFNFWYRSATVIADTDPIDVSVSSNKVATLTHAVPFARELMLFSKAGQFVLTSDGALTPKSVKCDQVTSFDYNPDVQPITIGPSLFFVNDRVNFSSLMRYYTLQDVAELKDAEDITTHVPAYVPKGIIRLSGTSSENVVTAISRYAPSTVYCYKFIVVNNTYTQQAWFKWKFAPHQEVLLAEFVDSELYFIVNSSEGLFLERTSLKGNIADFLEEPYRLFMDRKIPVVIPTYATYNDYDNTTTYSLSSVYGAVPPQTDFPYYVVAKDGRVAEVTHWNAYNGQFTIKGDWRGTTVCIGRMSTFKVQLSKAALKTYGSDGSVSTEQEGRLQLRYYWLVYSKSGVFDCHVDNPLKKKHFKYKFTGRNLGVSNNILGSVSLKTGKFKFPVQDNNEEVDLTIVSNNVQPLNLISGGWEGYYIRRSRAL